MTEWHRVVFSDESRFCLSSDSRRVRVWRRRGERSNPAAIVERPTVRQRGIMVWGAIAYDSRSPLLRIQGTMTAQRYVDDVLRPVTLPYLQGVPNALYQQDNARPHTARISQQALQDVQMLPWPPYSPDLSPIVHVWDIIGRRLHALPQPRSEDELWQMLIHTLVHRLWRRWLEQGNVAIYRNVGATRVTSARVDRRILRQAVAAPQATCTAILQHVQDTLDHSISTRTISRRLVANGLHSCRPLRRLPLTPPNRRQRLEWCRARSTWMTEWHRVVFSDESRFCLSSDSRRVRVWRRRGERSNPAAIVERPTVRQRGIMVWGAIAYDSRSPLLRIQGTMTAQRYVDDVLRTVTLPYLQGVPNALYQQDNARPHTTRISQQALQGVQMLPWPPYSPDLSPIEHVWDIIGRRLHALPQPRSEEELWQMVEREWRAIPQDAIRTLIDSLPRRVAACIAVRGGPTCY
ncbi:Transposase [Cordylochernes scorpioides]|uniref:Transposase n=1 Tax=Cordylochernes scorpioides TaxID=51811 RepID=A0ABY6L3F8_9ARAC|nr:Transposase [Cordylochernes scorpioides]